MFAMRRPEVHLFLIRYIHWFADFLTDLVKEIRIRKLGHRHCLSASALLALLNQYPLPLQESPQMLHVHMGWLLASLDAECRGQARRLSHSKTRARHTDG